ncbi:MAG: acyl-CoA dehydrogenase family protein, partial [Anaerotignaceae bacterium]
MDFTLSKEHQLLQEMYRKFAENEVKPLAEEVDETEEAPMENVYKMARYGMFGIPFPKEYGGQGADNLAYSMCVEELSKVCATTGVSVSAHTSLCANPIYEFGTEEQKQKYLVPLAKGEKFGAFGLTEPGAGTDAAGQQTKAYLDGDNWIINGSKIFITNAGFADIFIIIAMTDKSAGTKGISAFIVE